MTKISCWRAKPFSPSSPPAAWTAEKPNDRRTHYTYLVEYVEPSTNYPNESWFAKYFTGTENTNPRHYTYVGKLVPDSGFVGTTAKSRAWDGTTPLNVLNKVLARVWAGDTAKVEAAGWRVHHEGMCGCCGAPLTNPESIDSGYGPVCRKNLFGAPAKAPKAKKETAAVAAAGWTSTPDTTMF